MKTVLLLAVAVVCLARPALAQRTDFAKIQVVAEPAGENVWMLTGGGGNIGVSAGPDGVVLIDDQFAPLTEKIRAAVATISDKPIRFVINTHWHGDHVGGNENFGKGGAVIVAHENVRKRMSVDAILAAFAETTLAAPVVARPVITFTDAVSFYLNGDSLRVFHVAPAHTDGDAMIYFERANVLHMGDTFFNGMYPFIDVSSGGSLDGMIAATETALARVNTQTKIIPGHGPLADRAALQRFHDMLVGAHEAVGALVAQKKTTDQIVAAKPLAKLDADWGTGFLTTETFTRMLAEGMAPKQ